MDKLNPDFFSRVNTTTNITVSNSINGPASNTRSKTFDNTILVSKSMISGTRHTLSTQSITEPSLIVPGVVSSNMTTPFRPSVLSFRHSLTPIRTSSPESADFIGRSFTQGQSSINHDNTALLFSFMEKMAERDEKRFEQEERRYERELAEKRERYEQEQQEKRERYAREQEEKKEWIQFLRSEKEDREERENRILSTFQSFSESSQCVSSSKSLKMPVYDDNEDIAVFIQHFERIASLQGWPHSEWATRLGTLLKGKAAEAYSQVPFEDATDFQKVKNALYARFKLTAETYRSRFRSMKKENEETFTQFGNRMKTTLNRWISLSQNSSVRENLLEDLILREQLLNTVSPELDLFIRQNSPSSFEEATSLADKFAEAKVASRNKTTKSRLSDVDPKNKGKDGYDGSSIGDKANSKSFECYRCGSTKHFSRNCPNRFDPNRQASSTEQNMPQFQGKRVQIDFINSMSVSVISENDRKFYHPVSIEGKPCIALRDTGSTDSLVDIAWVPESAKTVGSCQVTLANGAKQILKQVELKLNTPFFESKILAAAVPNASNPLIIGNTVTFANGEKKEVPVFCDYKASAVVTRSQNKENVHENIDQSNRIVIPGTNLTPSEFKDIQSKDVTLKRYFSLSSENQNEKNGVSFVVKEGLLYRQFKNRKNQKFLQLVIPSSLIRTVLTIAHETPMAGHMGVRRTIDRVIQTFYWPGVTSSVRKFCRECDACQKAEPSSRTKKVPLGRMPIISEPFQRVAVDITGPIIPSASSGNKYILVVIDYATRYPEAIPLRNIEASTVAEALWNVWTHYGVPNEVLTDRGSQFTSSLMREVYGLLGIKGLTTTPYHAQANGLVERFNATLKSILKKLSIDQPKYWDRYINAALFAYREVPQESLGFSPFELLFGRRVRGPLSILRDIWTQEDLSSEVKTTAQYVFDLRNRISETCELAHANLLSAAERQERLFNRKAVDRSFVPGDEVLLLLPLKKNKLQLTWKGPFRVIRKVGSCDYVIQMFGKQKLFHANLLKKYYRSSKSASAAIVIEEEELVEPESTLPHVIQCKPETGIIFPTLKSKESVQDVHISDLCSDEESNELKSIVSKHSRIFTDLPLQCNIGECSLVLDPDTPVHVKQYPLPHSQDQVVKEEVQSMLAAGIIERSSSPFSSPILLVKKKDSSMRFCTDFRKLNLKLRFDAEPMPDVDSIFARLGKAKYFSKLDLSKGYFQIPMREQDRCKTAFTTPSGQYQFTVMPFGLRTAGAVFSRIMRIVLEPLKSEQIQNFMDDILVASQTWDQHLEAIQSLLNRLDNVNLSVRPTKCFLGFRELSFLGHKIGRGFMKPEEDKVEKILNAPQPQNKSQLRSFLGMAGYYRRFVDNYSSIALPLTNLTKKGSPDKLPWDQECQKSFDLLKLKLSSEPVLILPDESRTFVLRTDASGKSLGACLMQDRGQGLQPIAFASKKLNSAEQKYSTIEQECFGVVFGIRKFYPYLYGRDFVVETDHHPLRFLDRIRPLSRRLTAWAMELQSHCFTVRSIAGKENVVADYLSRM